MNKKQLLPCGCGGEAIVGSWWRYSVGKRVYAVSCAKCGIQIKPCDTEAAAIQAWNKAMGAKDINVPNKFATDINVGNKTVKFKQDGEFLRCGKCNRITDSGYKYCPNCGCRLEFE